jgi:peroxiredoxin
MIKPNDTIPAATLTRLDDDKLESISTASYFANRVIILIGMPGPFTPTCSKDHLPGYLHLRDELQQHVDAIAVIAVTDAYAMNAWSVTTGAHGQLDFLADGNGELIRAMGLEEDRRDDGMGFRSQRFSMLVEDGIVQVLHVEEDQSQTDRTGADQMLEDIEGLP